MRKILYLVISLSLFSCSSSDDIIITLEPVNNENDLMIVKTTTQMYNHDNGEPSTSYYINFYYENGHLFLSKTATLGFPEIHSEEFLYVNNKLVELKSKSTAPDNTISNEESIKYTYNGNLIIGSIRESHNENYPSIFIYNTNGTLKSKRENKPNGSLNEKSEYQYYPDGNISKITRTEANSSNPLIYIHELYDNKNNPMKLLYQNGLGKIIDESNNNILQSGSNTYEYEYNQYNYPTKRIEKNNNAILSVTTFEYNK